MTRPEPFYDVSTIARRLNVAGETVRSWIRNGKLRAYSTPTGRYRIPASAIKGLLTKQKAAPKKSAQDSQTQQL